MQHAWLGGKWFTGPYNMPVLSPGAEQKPPHAELQGLLQGHFFGMFPPSSAIHPVRGLPGQAQRHHRLDGWR